MLALPTTVLGTIILRATLTESQGRDVAASASRAVLRSTMPALDLAFGLDRETDLPENMAALIAKLDAGPLGARSQGPSPSNETAAPDLATAASGMSRWVVPACEPA